MIEIFDEEVFFQKKNGFTFRKQEKALYNKIITHNYMKSGKLFEAEVDYRVATAEEGRVLFLLSYVLQRERFCSYHITVFFQCFICIDMKKIPGAANTFEIAHTCTYSSCYYN